MNFIAKMSWHHDAHEPRMHRMNNALIEALRGFQSRLVLALHGIAERDLFRRDAEGMRSLADVVAHLADFELVTSYRVRTMLTSEPQAFSAFDPNRWLTALHAHERIADRLGAFWFHRRQNVALFEQLGHYELSRSAVHPDLGAITIQTLFENLRAHDEQHLAEIERVKSALGVATSDEAQLHGVEAMHASEAGVRTFGDGVRVRDLWTNGVKRALQVEFDAGAQWPGLDMHVPGPEEVYVVSGDFDDGAHVYGAGSFLHHPAGSSHSPRSAGGCTLFVFYPEG